MKKIYSGTDMKNVDNYTINSLGIPSLVLMERAALCVANAVKDETEKKIIAVCGTGNNGADGICAIRILYSYGLRNLAVISVGDESKATDEFKKQKEILLQFDVKYINIKTEDDIEECSSFLEKDNIILDAVFGIGLKREVTGIYKKLFEKINNINCEKIAVDIASGIDSNTGNILGCAIKCDRTITFGAYKIGHILSEGFNFSGEVEVYDIGFPVESYSNAEAIFSLESTDAAQLLPKRNKDSNKGTFGKITIIAGNEEMYGAAYMSALSAFYMGVGLVRVVTTKNNKELINQSIPEAIVNTYEEIEKAIMWSDVLVVGPGMGVSDRTYNTLKKVLETKKPVVIDADGINTFSSYKDLFQMLHKDVIFTPHLGEMSRLVNKSITEIKKDMIGTAKSFCKTYNINLVMKDFRTIITDCDGVTYINMTGNSGMSKAGSGDVLSGIMGAVLAMTRDVKKTSYLGPYIHGISGDIAKKEYGEYAMMPTDIIKSIKRLNTI